MKLEFGTVIFHKSNNKINISTHSIYWIPFIDIMKYFTLAIFELLTQRFIPIKYHDIKLFHIIIILIFCITIEILSSIIHWYCIQKKDRNENNKIYHYVDGLNLIHNIKNQNIYPGYIIYLLYDEISPVDGILIDTASDEHAKINLELLTGESNIHYISKPSNDLTLHDYIGSELYFEYVTPSNINLNINQSMESLLDCIHGEIILPQKKFLISKKNFVPSNSIVKSEGIYVWVVSCGKDKLNVVTKKYYKISFTDKFSDYLFIFLTLAVTLINTLDQEISNMMFILNCIQNWTLFKTIFHLCVKVFEACY